VSSHKFLLTKCLLFSRVCEKTLTGHSNVVVSVIQLSDGRLCSGSNDETIKIWNLTSGYCEQTLTGHSSIVYSVIQYYSCLGSLLYHHLENLTGKQDES